MLLVGLWDHSLSVTFAVIGKGEKHPRSDLASNRFQYKALKRMQRRIGANGVCVETSPQQARDRVICARHLGYFLAPCDAVDVLALRVGYFNRDKLSLSAKLSLYQRRNAQGLRPSHAPGR